MVESIPARNGVPDSPPMAIPDQVATFLSALRRVSTLPAIRALIDLGTTIAPEVCRRIAATFIGLLLAAGMFVTSLVFLTMAGHRALTLHLGNIGAALILGVVYLIASLLLLLGVRRRTQ